jgi:hypothetical protein
MGDEGEPSEDGEGDPGLQLEPQPGEIRARRQVRQRLLEDLWSELEQVAEEGDLAQLSNLIASTTLELDATAYAEVVDVLDETLERTLQILAASAQRLQALPAHEREERRTQLAILHYPHRRGAGRGERS